ncbi:hypothetical protein [Halostagnicola larsenii]|uniref:hypothetical protein n=1 Tax=Halostagnicola larsenii TaxID=353800 RepID=UPI0012FC3A03|nr:hypothetical protein [Halostagnicola larsenii]
MSQENTNVSIDLPSQAKSKAGLARGYSFQDTITGAFLLSVLFEDADKVMVEGAIDDNDRFDDLIVKEGNDIVCIQAKNGIGYSLSPTDLNDRSGRLDVEKMVESADSRIEKGQGDRFIVLTSYDSEASGDLVLEQTDKTIELLEKFEIPITRIEGEAGTVNNEVEIEFGLGLPGIPEAPEGRRVLPIDETELYNQIRKSVNYLIDSHSSPRLPEVDTLIKKAVILASDARDSPGRWLDRAEIAQRLGLDPRERTLNQQFPTEEEYIIPGWVQELIGTIGEGNRRVLIEGRPGSGKSTGVELYCTRSEGPPVFRYHLFVPGDSRSEAKRRIDKEWFRHQFAAQLYESFPEAFDRDSQPVWTDRGALQNYIERVANWADNEGKSPVLIVDGLDHVLREPGETNRSIDPHGTIIEEIGHLTFPAPLRLMLVSRELDGECYDLLDVDDIREVIPWQSREIELFLGEMGEDYTPELVESILNVSDGLPVIISHLVEQAQVRESDLSSVVTEAPVAEGDLADYYSTIWDPLSPVHSDIISLISISPEGIGEDLIKDTLGLPSIDHELDLQSPPISHLSTELQDGWYRVFHDSFGEYVKQELEDNEVYQLHTELYSKIFEHCRHFPAELDSLQYHAEQGPGQEDLATIINLETAFQWLENGAHPQLIQDMLQMLFEVTLDCGDYESAFDCAVIGAYFRNSVPHQQERLSYYVASGMREEAVDIVEQSIHYEPTNETTLQSIEKVANNWDDFPSDLWIEECEDQFFGSEDGEWRPDTYFNAVAAAFDPDEFWRRAGAVVGEDDGHFVFEVINAVREYPELLDISPPEWIFNDPLTGLEACSSLGPEIEPSWKEAVQSTSYDLNEMSVAALYSIALAHGEDLTQIEEVFERIREIGIKNPYAIENDQIRHSQSYYIGAIYSLLGGQPDELQELIREQSPIVVELDLLLASIGAYRCSENSTRSNEWIQFLMESIGDWVGPDTEIDVPRQSSPLIQYRDFISNAFSDLESDFLFDDSPAARSVPYLLEDTESEAYIQTIVVNNIERIIKNNLTPSEREVILKEDFQRYINADPSEEELAVELWDITIQAADEELYDFAEKCSRYALSRSFRYGNHKDVFLNEVWNALSCVAEDNWNDYQGVAIRLINWARLLHDMTDGDETRHFEGMFLRTLLDAGIISYDQVVGEVLEQPTLRKIHSWRINNPDGITEQQLNSVLFGRGRLGLRYSQSSVHTAHCAIVAADNGWDDKAQSALSIIQSEDQVQLEEEVHDRLLEVSNEYGIYISDHLSINEDSEGQNLRTHSEEEDTDYIDEILEKEPLEQTMLEDLSDDDLVETGRRVANTIKYRPKLVVPIAREMNRRGFESQAVSLPKRVISERNIMGRLMARENEFQKVALFLVEMEGDDALQHILEAWRDSSIIDAQHHLILSNLVWIVNQTEGQLESKNLVQQGVDWSRRLLQPHENEAHGWGVLSHK